MAPFVVYAAAIFAFFSSGWVVFIPLVYAWFIIPVLELFIRPDATNLDKAEEELALRNKIFDFFLYAVIPLQYFAIICFLYSISTHQQTNIDIAGKVMVMGLLCGVFGINVGHELGHRKSKFERLLARTLLLTSLYLHFYIEHNKGHHKRVATPEDPSSARKGENVYSFWLRSVSGSYKHAWHIAIAGQMRKGNRLPMRNEMLIYQLVQISFLAIIVLAAGWYAMLLFVIAAVQGFLLLETVNYIEHYGLARKQVAPGAYERARPVHSWNSNHIIGRLMLFELSRHSDHHFSASRKYQVLRHHEDSPQMPTGYPGMMLLSLIPPLWFRIMDQRIEEFEHMYVRQNKVSSEIIA